MSKPYISIVIPTHNRAEYIGQAVQSVLDQKNCPWEYEVLVIDDGSTDNTEDVLKPFKNKISYYKISHAGRPSVPRNIGIKKARGELIAFLDSDDLWTPDKLATQVPLFEDPKVVFSFANATIMTDNGKKTSQQLVTDAKLKQGEKFGQFVKENVVSTLTVMARKSVLEEMDGFNESPALKIEDYELWLRIVAKYPGGTRSVAQPLALYRQHDQSVSTNDALVSTSRLLMVYDTVWETAGLSDAQKLQLEPQIFTMHENWGRLMNEQQAPPAISVVMAAYNAAEHLRPTIESILAQTFKDFEFIIIDDGSTDTSAEIVRSYDDPRIRLLYQTNHKLVYSLNQGLALARAEFIARQDGDDISLPSRFEKELAWMSADERRGLVSSYFTYIDEKTAKPSITLTFPTKHIDITRNLYYTNPFAHSAAMIRRAAIVENGGYRTDYAHNEDYDLWRRIAKSWEIGIIPEVLLWYRINPNSISHTNQDSQHTDGARIIEELWSEPVPLKSYKAIVRDAAFYARLDPKVRQQYVDQQVQLGHDALLRGQIRAGTITALAALRLQPRSITRLFGPMLKAIPKRIIRS